MRLFCIQIFLVCLLISGCPNPSLVGVAKSVTTAAGVNDALLVDSSNGATLVVVASIDSEIQFFDIVDPDPTPKLAKSIFFKPNGEGVSPNPWSAAATSDGNFLAVSLYEDNSIALIDLKTRQLLSSTKANQEKTLHPTAIAIVGNQVLALFTNFEAWTFAPGVPAKYGTAKLGRFKIVDNALHFMDAIELPCKNPNAITIHDNHPVVACAGSLKSDAKGNLQLHFGAALVRLQELDPDDLNLPLSVDSAIGLNNYSPSKVLATSDGYFLTSSITKQILYVPSNAMNESETQVFALDPEKPEAPGYFPSFVKWQNDIAFVSDFKSDTLVAFDLESYSFFPSSFPEKLALRSFDSEYFFKGPQVVVARGNYLYTLFSLSSEIVPLNLNEAANQ